MSDDNVDRTDVERIRFEMYENHSTPNGAVRNARAEALVERAEATGDTALLLEALSQLITAYEYSSERSRMFVPFARLLRMWDEDPGRFDGQMAIELFWRFKWVTGSMVNYPEIPLASIEQWLGEMERRYRLAGYNSRTVRAEEFCVAWHIGDQPRAERAYAEWLAGDRDRMSNCLACEANERGSWELHNERDEAALTAWAEVLGGRLTCAEEPHRVLSYSLLPLLRTGRLDQARTNHLRGYRLARGNESLLHAVAYHVEFCALTGNEARGLEILAEHARHLTIEGNPIAQRAITETAVLLLDRLLLLGLGEQPTPGPPGTAWTVRTLRDHCEAVRAELVARFDRRNGSDFVSGNSLSRTAQQPLLEHLPLGVNAALPDAVRLLPTPAAAAVATAAPVGTGLEDLLAEARRLRDLGHPGARAAWLAVEEALADAHGDPNALLRAEIATQRGIRLGRRGVAEAITHFEAAAADYREAGRPGDAAANEARAAIAAALLGRTAEAERRAADAVAAVRGALTDRQATTRHLAMVLLCRAKVLTASALEDEDAPASAGQRALAATDEAVAAVALRDGLDPNDLRRMDGLLADAHHNRAALLQRQTPRLAVPELRSAADLQLRAQAPWEAARPLMALARLHASLGELDLAETVAEEALRHGGGHLDAEDSGSTHLLLADLLGHREAHQDAVRHALEATRRLEQAGHGAEAGAAARYRLAQSYQALDRHAEAAEVLQAALPDLLAHGEQTEVTARRTLGRSLSELNEHAAAAEQFALAAAIVDGWGEPYPSAQLASSTAEALSAAGRTEQAEAAYLRAQEHWGRAGVPAMVVRTLRARAWMTFRRGRDADPGRALMRQAERTAAAALADPGLDPGDADELRRELADTWRQLGSLLRNVAEDEGWQDLVLAPGVQAALYSEAREGYFAAAERFAECAAPGPAQAVAARLDAAEVLVETGRHPEAAAELKHLLAEAESGGEELAAAAQRIGALLAWIERQPAG